MSKFVTPTDFKTGRNAVAQNIHNVDNLQQYIDDIEKTVVYELFGVTMGGAIYNDPLLFPELQEPFFEEIEDVFTESKGLKHVLTGIIFFLYERDRVVKSTNTGAKSTKGSVGEQHGFNSFDSYTRYNNSITSYEAIQKKCMSDKLAYPDFKGIVKKRVINI
jgi:hypothetical protein